MIVYTTATNKETQLMKDMASLRLFNAVIAQPSIEPVVLGELGIIVSGGASYMAEEIELYYTQTAMTGDSLNQTFYKSWSRVENSSRFQLYMEQVAHYMSTYGTDFEGEVYIPYSELDIVEKSIATFKVVNAYTAKELETKCLELLESGFALTQETIEDIIEVLDQVGYVFTNVDNIKNKEAMAIISKKKNILPTDTMDFMRRIVFESTGSTLLIKNNKAITFIKNSPYDGAVEMSDFGVEKLATIYNRFKPLFLAYKGKKPASSKVINKIAKLSKKLHQPMAVNPMNLLTSQVLGDKDQHWIDNATTFAIIKAVGALHTRLQGQDTFVYNIRNGRMFAKEAKNQPNTEVLLANYNKLLFTLADRLDIRGKEFYIPSHLTYGLATSEKQFVGNVPFGTKIKGKDLSVGIYWENAWGARDLDLSGRALDGTHVGWNSDYNKSGITYSGDMTDATDGAVEFMKTTGNIPTTMLNMNIYSGKDDSAYTIVVGQGAESDKKHMMNPEDLFFQAHVKATGRQMMLGLVKSTTDGEQEFIMMNSSNGGGTISGEGQEAFIEGTTQTWDKKLTFNSLVTLLGGKIVEEMGENTIDLSVEKLEKDTFTELLKG